MTEQELPWESVPELDAVPETSPAVNTDTPDTPIAVSIRMQFCRRTADRTGRAETV
ncbi:MAG: hypothetical protein ACLR5S_10970 [Ruminococcus sp.]